MEIVYLIISLISGAVGGNIAGGAMPDKNLGTAGNTVTGLIGGGIVDFILKALGVLGAAHVAPGATTAATDAMASGLDLTSILAAIVGGGAGGGVLTAIVALIKDTIQKK